MRVVEGTLPFFDRRYHRMTVALPGSSFRRRGSPPSSPWLASQRPTPRRDGPTLRQTRRSSQTIHTRTPHAIHDVLYATRLTSPWIRFSFVRVTRRRSTSSARSRVQSDKRESYVVRRIGNQTFFSEALEIFLDGKKENAARWSGVHNL